MAIGTTVKLGFDGTAVQRGLAALPKSLASLSSRLSSIGKDIAGTILRPITQLTSLLAPTALVGGMVAFGKASSDAAANIENMRAQFDLFTGSTNGTEKLIKDLRKIAVESPLELTDISEGARSLLTYGVAADQVAPIISRLSEISAGSAERFDRITYAFGQIESIGRLMGTELRQLTEAGFNPLEFISKKTGETMIELKKRMEDGGIGIDEVRESLIAATSAGGRFEGMNAKMAQTFTGRVSMMKDQWSQLTQAFGDGMNQGLKVAVDAVTNAIPQFIEKFKTIGTYFGNAIGEAVNGDYEKFVAIGDFIGTAIGVAATSAFQKTASEIGPSLQKLSKDTNSPLRLTGIGAVSALLPQAKGLSFPELLQSNAINAGLSGKAQAIMGGQPAGYSPSPQSPAFIEASLKQFSAKIDQIEKNTRKAATTGAKM